MALNCPHMLKARYKYFESLVDFCTSTTFCKQQPTNLKGKSKSSQEWLIRQLSDPYVEKAKMENYRCRSAFKLIEIDDKFRLLSAGQSVVDCGAAPGSWTQVLVRRTNADGKHSGKPMGKVIAIDQLPIYPIEGATIMGNADFTIEATQTRVQEFLAGQPVAAVLSDMAPRASGIQRLDHENIIHLAYNALRFAVKVSSVGATVLLKIWDGGDSATLQADMARFYDKVRVVKPSASRTDSAEIFLLARGFKGLVT